MSARVALATSAELPGLADDDGLLLAELLAAGLRAEPAVWDDPAVDWGAYDLVVVRSTWDYTLRRDEFLAWAAGVPRLANPAPVLAWNTDKTYLRDLQDAGVPVVPTTFLAPGEAYDPPPGPLVVKPAVSAGARDTQRYEDGRAGADLVARLHAQGRTAMVQPYLDGVDRHGETAVVVVDGAVSHGARKAPLLLPGAPDPDDDLATVTPREPSVAEVAVAHAALAAVPHPGPLLYARVDLVPGPTGEPTVLELELTEPSLFLRSGPGAAGRLARAVLRRLG